MISRREILIKMGIIKSTDELLADVEKCIIDAAEKGERHIEYTFSEKFDKEAIDALYQKIISCGYTTQTSNKYPYRSITISW